ncbi:hypothetical protein B0H19DRAFT_345377 [Mycena capillaripes]|nr:hypothetical protein B0H19DRAFT_345377 [Mycena capillaripes]
MSYNRYNNSYDYGSDSDDDVPPPPPPPPARYGYSTDSGPVDYTPPAQYGFPQPPPSLQPGGGRYSTPPPGGYQSPPSTYRSPPASTYREPTPPNYHGSTPPSYNQPPLSNYSPSLSSYNQVPRDSYSQVPPPPPPPKGAYRGGSPASGGYRASPPPSARGSQPPSAYSGSPQLYTSSALKRTESYTEDYSAYGISAAAARTQTGGYNTGDDAPPAFDRRKTEHMALTIATNVKRDEESISAKFGDLVSSSAEKLTKAQDVVEKVIQNDTYKLAKDQVEAIFSPAKDVIAFLDVIKSIHPVVGTVTTIFTALIKLEVDRRENDRSIAVLHLAMTNLLFILSCLEPTFATPDKMQTMLQKYLEDVCRTMNAFGNFCDVYYKHGSIVRMIRSHGYKTKLAGYGTSFEDHKKELQYLMTTKTAGTVTQMNSNVQNISMQLNQVLAFINQQSPKEKAIVKKIQEYPGGEDEAVKDDKLLAKISKLAKENITSQIKYALRENIDDAIKSNFALFSLKVETAMNEIKDAVARSTDTIMARLDSGPHDLITDEDIKTVWKQMNWRLSCKCRHFVDAVHHHYAQVFGKYTLETGEPHPEHWTLTFLSNIIFYPAIGDAIDEDGSGYLSVHEVDRFFNSRPTGWTPTQWMAYWAAGWYVNAVGYRHRIIVRWPFFHYLFIYFSFFFSFQYGDIRCSLSQAMMNSIKEASEKILPQNKSLLRPYLKKGCYGKIMLMIEGL